MGKTHEENLQKEIFVQNQKKLNKWKAIFSIGMNNILRTIMLPKLMHDCNLIIIKILIGLF